MYANFAISPRVRSFARQLADLAVQSLVLLVLSVPGLALSQIAMTSNRPAEMLNAESARSPEFSPLERAAIREALATLPFKLPDALAKRVAKGDQTPLVVAGLEALRSNSAIRNLTLARAQFERAATQMDPRAILALAILHADGLGAARDLKQASALLGRLRAVDYPRAHCVQAELDTRLPGGDHAASVLAALVTGASRGDAVCQNLLGIRYEREGRVATAQAMYRQSASQGNPAAIKNLTRLDTSAFDPAEQSVQTLKERAQANDPLSQFELARRYHRGIGLTADLNAAFDWYAKAAPYHPLARAVIATVLERSPDYSKGVLNLEALAELANLPAIAAASNYLARLPPSKDHDLLAGLEALASEPFDKRLRGEVSTTRQAAEGSVKSKVVISVPDGGATDAWVPYSSIR